MPTNLNGKQKSALKDFASVMGEAGFKSVTEEHTINAESHDDSREDKGFFGKMKDAFSVD